MEAGFCPALRPFHHGGMHRHRACSMLKRRARSAALAQGANCTGDRPSTPIIPKHVRMVNAARWHAAVALLTWS